MFTLYNPSVLIIFFFGDIKVNSNIVFNPYLDHPEGHNPNYLVASSIRKPFNFFPNDPQLIHPSMIYG